MGEEAALVRDIADWRILERDLGPDGVHAIEIELAGPAVSRIANDLLAACYGPRFALRWRPWRHRRAARGKRRYSSLGSSESAAVTRIALQHSPHGGRVPPRVREDLERALPD